MNKKLITACLALVAFAAMAVVPALASASVVTEGSTAVATNTKIVAKNTGNVKFTTPIGTIECTNARMTGTLVKNNGTEFEITISTVEINNGTPTSPCTTSFLGNVTVTPKRLPWCIKAGGKILADTFELVGADCPTTSGTTETTFATALAGECTYTRSSLTGSFTTGTTSTFKTEKAGSWVKVSGGSGCFASFELDMTFDIYTDVTGAETQLGIS